MNNPELTKIVQEELRPRAISALGGIGHWHDFLRSDGIKVEEHVTKWDNNELELEKKLTLPNKQGIVRFKFSASYKKEA